MSTIVTRAGKGSPLTHTEVDTNFTNLNTDKVETSGGSLTNPSISGNVSTTGINFDSNTFVIDATNDRVGVGTASPSERLEVSGNLAFSTDATIRRTTSDGSDNSYVAVTGGGALSIARGSQVVSFGNEHATDAGKLNLWSGNVANSEVVLNAYSSSSIIKMLTNNTERMRIDSSGNLLVGTTSALSSSKVRIFTGSSGAGSVSANYDELVLEGSGAVGMTILAPSTGSSNIGFGDNNNNIIGRLNYDHTNDSMQFFTNTAERMRLDSSGNLGLGVTPSAWGSGYKALEISGGSLATTGSTDVRLYQNVFYSGTANTYKTTAAATLYYQGAGQHQWFNAPSGTAGTTATFTQAMTLDASGDLSLGNTNSDYRLNVFSGTNNSTIARFTGAQSRGLLISTFSQNGNDNGANLNAVGDGTNAALSFSTLSTERMRIDSSGNLLVGTTTIDPTFNRVNGLQITPAGSIFARANNPWDLGRSVTSGIHISFYTDNGSARVTAGNISSNGSTTTYATSSDYRMKTDVQPMTNALNKVMQLNPVTYKWVNGLGGTKENGEGFIAHELQEVVPDCVTGEKDAVDADGKPVYQGIDVSFLVATLTASIQELKAIVDAQAERIAVLESK